MPRASASRWARRLQERRSGDRRSSDAFRTAPVQGVGQNRRDDACPAAESKAKARLARYRHDREQTTAGRRAGLFVVAGRRRGAVIVMMMGSTVRVDVNLAPVVVHANVTLGQAMRGAGIGGESEGSRWRENAKQVERGKDDRRFDAKGFGQDR